MPAVSNKTEAIAEINRLITQYKSNKSKAESCVSGRNNDYNTYLSRASSSKVGKGPKARISVDPYVAFPEEMKKMEANWSKLSRVAERAYKGDANAIVKLMKKWKVGENDIVSIGGSIPWRDIKSDGK